MKKKIISIGNTFCLFCFLSFFSCDKNTDEGKDLTPLSQSQKSKLAQSSLRSDYKKIAEKIINDPAFLAFDKAYAQLNFDAANRTYGLDKFDRKALRKKKDKIKTNNDLVKAYKDAGMKGDVKAYLLSNMLFLKSRSDLLNKYPELQKMTTKEFSELYFTCTTNTFKHKKSK